MPSTSFHFDAAVKAFGGWPGVVAFYFVGLAFPLRYALRTFYAHDRKQLKQQMRELRIAGYIVFFSALLAIYHTSEKMLERHVDSDSQLAARGMNFALTLLCSHGIAPVLTFYRAKRMTTVDRDMLSPTNVNEELLLSSRHPSAKGPLKQAYAQYYIESTWLFLFTLWLMNMAGGILTICVGLIVKHKIVWYLFPFYNIGGHVAILHAMVGVFETIVLLARVRVMKWAIECPTEDALAAYWGWVKESLEIKNLLLSAWYGWPAPTPSPELGFVLGGRSDERADEWEEGRSEVADLLVDEKLRLMEDQARGRTLERL